MSAFDFCPDPEATILGIDASPSQWGTTLDTIVKFRLVAVYGIAAMAYGVR
jgi:hypothetical protein